MDHSHHMGRVGDQAVHSISGHEHHNHPKQSGTSEGDSHAGHGMSMSMSMVFHGGYNETVLFDFWNFSSIGGLLGSIIVIFIMATLYEGLKYYREYLFWKTYNRLQYKAVQGNVNNKDVTVEEDTQVVHMMSEVYRNESPSMFSKIHGWQTFLHAIQVTISYFLMLIFMTYNTWLCLAVVLGAAAGNFLFGWRKHVIVDVTEHCH